MVTGNAGTAKWVVLKQEPNAPEALITLELSARPLGGRHSGVSIVFAHHADGFQEKWLLSTPDR